MFQLSVAIMMVLVKRASCHCAAWSTSDLILNNEHQGSVICLDGRMVGCLTCPDKPGHATALSGERLVQAHLHSPRLPLW